jgi:hypothetical protein
LEGQLVHLVYEIVKHGDGWASQVGETISGIYASHDLSRLAAVSAAREHELIGNTVGIEFEDSNGKWHQALSDGNDRPSASVDG